MKETSMWKKLGCIFKAENQTESIYSHTAMPQAYHLYDDIFRIYFGSRNKNSKPSINYVEIDIKEPNKILKISENPVLEKSEWGMFDDNGLYPGNLLKIDEKLYMYYMGRSNGQEPLYYMAIGLAQSDDNGLSFQKISKAPILDRNKYDPWMTTTPFIMKEDKVYHMWYTSGFGWNMDKKNPKSYYHIKYAKSFDVINWEPTGKVCIDLKDEESNIAAPTVLKEDGIYKMWYSYVDTASYKIGYAESENGLDWIRKDEEVGISLSDSGWDSECMAYPCVFLHKGKKYMLYSGNTLGKEGIGLAVNLG